MLGEDFNIENAIAIPVDVNSLMAAYHLGYLVAINGDLESDLEKPTPQSYCRICEEMSIAPADNINDLISEIVSSKVSELLKEKQAQVEM